MTHHVDRHRLIFAEELERSGETGLASMVKSGLDNSGGGTAALKAIERAVIIERTRCAISVCPDCAAGDQPDKDGSHILEVIQGHVAHSRRCPAWGIWGNALKTA